MEKIDEIKTTMEKRGMTARQLSIVAQIPESSISIYLNGKREMGMKTYLKIL